MKLLFIYFCSVASFSRQIMFIIEVTVQLSHVKRREAFCWWVNLQIYTIEVKHLIIQK